MILIMILTMSLTILTKEGKMAELELLEQAILANSMTEVECRLTMMMPTTSKSPLKLGQGFPYEGISDKLVW